MLWSLLLPAVLVGAAEAAYAVALLRTRVESPTGTTFSSIFLARSLALVALALGLTREVVRTRRTRAAVARLANELGEAPPPGKLRETLAGVLGDPALDVVYWLPRSQRFVDASGRARSAPVAGQGRALTPILREGRTVAVVIHDAATVDGSRLQQEIGGAARLAVENERLQAEVLAQLAELRASRVRIVELGDAARRRLERDLHDGAQQRLLALSYELRLAHAAAVADGDPALEAMLGAACDEAQATLDELRESRARHLPGDPRRGGPGPGTRDARRRRADPRRARRRGGRALPAAVESAAYVVVSRGGRRRGRRGAPPSSRSLPGATADRLVIDVDDDGQARDAALVHVADRVGALGGDVQLGATDVRAEIPCA